MERSVSLFLAQIEPDAELIIYNTDIDHPVVLSDDFRGTKITVVNNGEDFYTNAPYTNIGAIRRDALSHALGSYYICWDDDDIFLPWNNAQCLSGIQRTGAWAWKPRSSMWSLSGHGIEIAQNVMEASIIARTDKVRQFGFRPHLGGGEHIGWIEDTTLSGKFISDKYSIPAYSFNWSDPPEIGGHKQSGTIDDPNNFERHKSGCTDIHTRPLQRIDVSDIIDRYSDFLRQSAGMTIKGHFIYPELIDKYVSIHEHA